MRILALREVVSCSVVANPEPKLLNASREGASPLPGWGWVWAAEGGSGRGPHPHGEQTNGMRGWGGGARGMKSGPEELPYRPRQLPYPPTHYTPSSQDCRAARLLKDLQ